MKMNSLYSIMVIAAILSLSFCKSNKNDPDPDPTPGNGDTPGITYTQQDNSALPKTIQLTEGTDSDYSYMIVLTKQPTDDVTINISLNNSPDNLRIDKGGTSVTSTSIIFSVDEWDMPQTINLTFTDNDIFFGLIMSTLTHSISSTDTSYENLPNKKLMINLIDDEIPPCDQSGAVAEDDFTPDISGEDYWRWNRK